MVRRIVNRFDPDRIILFGSNARGSADENSDVDFLVVLPVAGSKREKQVELRCALHNVRTPKDIVVVTPEEFAARRKIPGTLVQAAVKEGKVLYARSG